MSNFWACCIPEFLFSSGLSKKPCLASPKSLNYQILPKFLKMRPPGAIGRKYTHVCGDNCQIFKSHPLDNLNALISICFSLAPKQESFFSGLLFCAFVFILILIDVDLDLLDLEAEDDCPDKSQDHPRVAIHNVLCSNVLKSHLRKIGLGNVFQESG